MKTFTKRLDAYLENLQSEMEQLGVYIPPQGLLAGPVAPIDLQKPRVPFHLRKTFGWDNAHFPMGYGLLMEAGVAGIARRASTPQVGIPPEQAAYRSAIADAYAAVQAYIAHHAERAEVMASENPQDAPRLRRIAANCRQLAQGAPQTFEQGLQLFWFLWRLRTTYTSCIGRMDVHMAKLYARDVPERMPRDEALGLLCELWGKLNAVFSGDTLMNLMIGGVDEDGADVSSDLSLLIMEATMRSPGSEPHINIRIHDGAPEAFVDMAARLVAMGEGQGVLYYDNAIIPPLVRRGIPLEHARVYANDGCTEITFDSQGAIWFWQMEMVKTLELAMFRGQENPSAPHKTLHKWYKNAQDMVFETSLVRGHDSGDMASMASFDAVYDAFLNQFTFQTTRFLDRMADAVRENVQTDTHITSLLVAGMVPKTLDTGMDPMRGGWPAPNYQLLSGSIPTVADALYAIKEVVFAKGLCDMRTLIAAIEADFEGYGALRAALLAADKFGNDSDGVDAIAADLARRFCDLVEEYEAPCGVSFLPGIYNIDFHMFAGSLGATPDGRKGGDMICEHYSPTPGRAKQGPTAVMRSAAKADLARGCAASPLYLAMPRAGGAGSPAVARRMIEAGRALNLPILSLAYYDKQVLEDAVRHPEKHEDLIVRVWGFNARFIDLDDGLQQHVMERMLS